MGKNLVIIIIILIIIKSLACIGGELEGNRATVEEDILGVVLPRHHHQGLQQRVLRRREGGLNNTKNNIQDKLVLVVF
jgi:hypothetical protein